MRIIQEAMDKLYDVIDEIDYYATTAFALKQDHKILAEGYIKAAEAHVDIFRSLHETVVKLIADQKEKGKAPTPEMQAIYDHLHKRAIERFNAARVKLEEAKKSY